MSNRRFVRVCAAIVLGLISFDSASAQIGNQQVGAAPQQNAIFGAGPGQGVNAGNSLGTGQGNPGGAESADFDSLMDLIASTVAPDTWAENGGGEAEMRPFPTGVMVDAAGTLKLVKSTVPSEVLAARRVAPPLTSGNVSDPRHASTLRFVSLPRLEREIIRRQDSHEKFDPTMLTLAGLQRVQYVFVYPPNIESPSGDIVLGGPAGDWQIDPAGRILSTDTGAPLIRLDDLLTLLRRSRQSNSSFFGCMINPRQEALAATQTFLDKSGATPLQPGERKSWLEQIRSTLGRQNVEIFGIDPTCRVARVLVEADVHMKLIGMGLEEGVPGVESYLDAVKTSRQPPATMAVLRWWFALNYAAIKTSPDGSAYELIGEGARVLSENEALAAQGQRIHTGQSDPLNQKFADCFTAHFAELADKYPVYGELRAIFDLSLALALIDADRLAERAQWKPSRFLDNEKLRLPQWPAPREVDTVANCVVVNRRQVIAGVSGGVMVEANATLANRTEDTQVVLPKLPRALPLAEKKNEPITWWWDAKN